MQEGYAGALEEKTGGWGTPRGFAARPPLSVAEADPTDDVEPSLPTLGELKLSLLGSYDSGRSPPVALFSGCRCGDVGAVSPSESARSSISKTGEESGLSISDAPDTGTSRRKNRPSSSACSSSSASSLMSPPVDKLLHLPRGRSLRFFIDGDEGLAKEKKGES